MHQPRPHGQHAVGGELTDEDSAAVELLARRLTNLIQLSGVSSLRMVRTLPDGGYVIAQDVGGVFRAITHKPAPPAPQPPFDGVAKEYLPMLFSGTVTKAILRGDEGLGMRLTEQARKRIAGYSDKGLPPDRVALQRFRVRIGQAFSEFEPKPSALLHTQYAQQRPTWYSGAMAEVMQIVGGYGRQDLPELPDTPIERARLTIPDSFMQKIRLELGNVRLPGYTGLPDKEGEFKCDYKFNSTNVIGFDAQNKPWLLRIGQAGVWAMPLPLVPASTTAAFREYMEEVGDAEIIAILDRFGGMPSGESFPVREDDFEAWRRAGVYIKVCDTADFYDHIMYSSACGWSVNSSGTEGYNTCYDYYDDEGLGYGLTYKLKITLGSAIGDGKLPPPLDLDDPVEARKMDAYLSALYQQLSANKARDLAIKYKLRRVSVSQIKGRFGGDPKAEAEYWDKLELGPIASHSGSVTEVGRGYLYHGAPFKNQPQIKFPEPFMGGCVSHNFLPLINGRYKSSYPSSDTIMFCYYIEDDLKVVKYFRDGRGFDREIETDFEECMTVGSWTQVETSGGSSLVGNFYSSDIDERKEMAPQIKTTKIEGRDLGYDHTPFFSFDYFFWKPGTLWRNRYFTHKTNTDTTSGQSMALGVCIPYLCRNALIHAKLESTSGATYSEGLSLKSIQDPTTYRYWTYDFIWAWAGGLEKMDGRPYPKDGNPVWVEIENYSPWACSDFADNGPWIPGLPADFTWLIHPNRNEWRHSGGGGAPTVDAYYKSTQDPNGKTTGEIKVSLMAELGAIKVVPSTMYFHGSPSEFGDIFYRDAARVAFGEAVYGNVSEEVDGGRKRWGFTRLADHKSAHHFVGVINE